MSKDTDDILSLPDSSSEFSGFNSDDLNVGANETIVSASTKTANASRKRLKSVVVNPKEKRPLSGQNKTPTAVKNNKKTRSKNAKKSRSQNVIDLNNLTPDNVSALRQALGFDNSSQNNESNVIPNLFSSQEESENEPNNTRQYRSPLESVDRSYNKSTTRVSSVIEDALFDEECSSKDPQVEDEEWELPELKAPQLGEDISSSLAKLISTACTSQCMTDEIVQKYKIPKNCEEMGPPRVNNEIYERLNKKAQVNDRNFRVIQQLVASAMIPIVKLASLLKSDISKVPEAKKCISDSVTLLGQVQYNLSLRRRYMIRPHLKKRYTSLCNINTPITNQLFGNDIGGEIKKCETGMRLNEITYQYQRFGNGRGHQRPFGGGSNAWRGRGGRRFHPYQGQQLQTNRPVKTSTVTRPNTEQ